MAWHNSKQEKKLREEIQTLSNDLKDKDSHIDVLDKALERTLKQIVALEKLLEVYQLVFSDINQEDLHWIDWKRIDKADKEYNEKTCNKG